MSDKNDLADIKNTELPEGLRRATVALKFIGVGGVFILAVSIGGEIERKPGIAIILAVLAAITWFAIPFVVKTGYWIYKGVRPN